MECQYGIKTNKNKYEKHIYQKKNDKIDPYGPMPIDLDAVMEEKPKKFDKNSITIIRKQINMENDLICLK